MKALKWPAVKAERSEPKGSLDSNRAAKELKSRKVGTEVKQRKSAKKLDWEKRSQILQKNCCLIRVSEDFKNNPPFFTPL